MNAFAWIFSLLGGARIAGMGKTAKESGAKNPKSNKEKDDEPVVTTNPEPEEPVAEEPQPTVEAEQPDALPTNPEPQVSQDQLDDEEPLTSTDVVNENPTAPEQTGEGSTGGETAPVVVDGTVEVMAGRVATLSAAGDDVVGVRIVSDVENGNITVNPDNTFALVMTQSDFVGSQGFTYEATHADGSVSTHEVGMNVIPGVQDGGWATGESHYMLATDENDRVIVEAGENHTKVYVSGSNEALSIEDIAEREGLDPAQITGEWLAANGSYGQSEDLALDTDAGHSLWKEVSSEGSETSNWLLFERGYEYEGMGLEVFVRGSAGEDELHPMYMGAWGEGDRPEIVDPVRFYGESVKNLVIQDIHFSDEIFIAWSENVIFDNVEVSGTGLGGQHNISLTIRNSVFHDNYHKEPIDNDDNGIWDIKHVQGTYQNYVSGLLMSGNFYHQNGYAADYAEDGSTDGGQPPTIYNHNLYLGADNHDVTLTDTILMSGSSFGAQIRSGGFVEDNIAIDNNIGFVTLGGDYGGAGHQGEYSLFNGNIVTAPAHHLYPTTSGGLSSGIHDRGELSTLLDNIVTHLIDPNNIEGESWKESTGRSVVESDLRYYDDTIVYNWEGSGPSWSSITEQNAEGLDTNVLDQTTIQLFTEQLLGKPDATIDDLAAYLREQYIGEGEIVVDADTILEYFRSGFGIGSEERVDAQTIRFIPDDLGDGVRWDNRLNWETNDVAGLHEGDSVDLGGNEVVFGHNTTIDTLGFGAGGSLNVYGGKLTLTGGLDGDEGARLNIEGAGQVWTEGGTGTDIDISGGRFVNTGEMSDTDLTVTGGETILASDDAEFDVTEGRTLAIFAVASKVGFDGNAGGMAILDLHEGSTLAFAASDGDMGSIEEFRSGAFGDEPDVQSGIDLGNSTLEIDLSGLSAGAGSAFTLMDSDELVGLFDSASIGGLGARDATIVVDYINDSVTLELSAGTGAVSVQTLGDEADHEASEDALWAALTDGQGFVEEQALVEEDEALLIEAA